MIRLPKFRYVAPKSLNEAVHILSGEGPDAMLLAGGTDLFPNMKRRQQMPKIVVGLRGLNDLQGAKKGKRPLLGSMLTLTDLTEQKGLKEGYGALYKAAYQVATPQIRNMGTLGGNLCLDTRCNYYDQSFEWRKSIDFCMKKDGSVCWVAPSSPRCWAVSSTDTAPALIALGARVILKSKRGDRMIDVDQLYKDDGISYLSKKRDELLTGVELPEAKQWKSTYWKLRRRGSFDFPILSVAAAIRMRKDKVEEARIVLGAIASRPLWIKASGESLAGRHLTDSAIEEAAEIASKPAKPLDNTDFLLAWRKKMVRLFVSGALKELRGDQVRDIKIRSSRMELPVATL